MAAPPEYLSPLSVPPCDHFLVPASLSARRRRPLLPTIPPVVVSTPVASEVLSTLHIVAPPSPRVVPAVHEPKPLPAGAAKPAADASRLRRKTTNFNLSTPFHSIPRLRRHIDVDPSMIRQVDGHMVCLYGRDARIERDVCASSFEQSFTNSFGLRPYDCISTFNGLFVHDFHVMPECVAAAASLRACGAFLVPVCPGAAPSITLNGVTLPWFDFLLKSKVLSFKIPRSSVSGSRWQGGVMIIVAQFGRNGRLHLGVNPRRPECDFVLTPEYPCDRKLPVHPELIARSSPLADALSPDGSMDRAPRAPVWIAPPGAPVPTPSASRWPVENMKLWSIEFPYPDIRDFAVQGMEGTLDLFVGDIEKPVFFEDRFRFTPEVAVQIYDNCSKLVADGVQWGPLPYCPFPYARPYPPGLIKKFKYKPECNKMRLKSDCSAGSPYSVNDLGYSPLLLQTHFNVPSFVNLCVWHGVGLQVSGADLKSAFKMNPNHPDLMGLFVTMVDHPVLGRSFFGDRANYFGWRQSEWVFQTQLALVGWLHGRWGVKDVYFYVDNDYQFHPLGSDVQARVALLEDSMSKVGWGGRYRHERFSGTVGKVLGWEYDLASQHPEGPLCLICAEDKFVFVSALLDKWVVATQMSLSEARQAKGYMQFLCEGFTLSRAFAAKVSVFCELLERKFRKARAVSPSSSPDSCHMNVTLQARRCFSLYHQLFVGWSRRSPMIMGFGPFCLPEIRGWVDTSTSLKRVGGVFFEIATGILLGFSRLLSDEEAAACKGVSADVSAAFELMGVCLWWRLFHGRCNRKRVLLETDSEAGMLAAEKAFSPNAAMYASVQESFLLAARQHARLRIRATPAHFPTLVVVDHLSRDRVQEAQCVAAKVFGRALHLAW